MSNEKENGVDLGAFGILLGVMLVIFSVIWVTYVNINSQDDDKSGEWLTWVG